MFYDANIGKDGEKGRTWIIIGDFILNIGFDGFDGFFLLQRMTQALRMISVISIICCFVFKHRI